MDSEKVIRIFFFILLGCASIHMTKSMEGPQPETEKQEGEEIRPIEKLPRDVIAYLASYLTSAPDFRSAIKNIKALMLTDKRMYKMLNNPQAMEGLIRLLIDRFPKEKPYPGSFLEIPALLGTPAAIEWIKAYLKEHPSEVHDAVYDLMIRKSADSEMKMSIEKALNDPLLIKELIPLVASAARKKDIEIAGLLGTPAAIEWLKAYFKKHPDQERREFIRAVTDEDHRLINSLIKAGVKPFLDVFLTGPNPMRPESAIPHIKALSSPEELSDPEYVGRFIDHYSSIFATSFKSPTEIAALFNTPGAIEWLRSHLQSYLKKHPQDAKRSILKAINKGGEKVVEILKKAGIDVDALMKEAQK
jgi:hypothetical protein